jgi:hypothetical protein
LRFVACRVCASLPTGSLLLFQAQIRSSSRAPRRARRASRLRNKFGGSLSVDDRLARSDVKPAGGRSRHTSIAHQAPPADVVPPTKNAHSGAKRRHARARLTTVLECCRATRLCTGARSAVLLWPTHSSRPGARTRLTGRERRRRARDRRQRAAPLSHRHEQQQDDCRPTNPRDRSAHTTRRTGGRRRAATAAQTASRCVGSGRAGSRPHTRRARPIGRRANDERAAQHSVAVAAAAVVRRASCVGRRAHTCTAAANNGRLQSRVQRARDTWSLSDE